MAKQIAVTKKAAARAVSTTIASNPPKLKLTSGQKRTITGSAKQKG
ncbi:MAG: hypothetical protein QOG90_1748 [Actinomycetota bacterium]|jgi:hypothetical protein